MITEQKRAYNKAEKAKKSWIQIRASEEEKDAIRAVLGPGETISQFVLNAALRSAKRKKVS